MDSLGIHYLLLENSGRGAICETKSLTLGYAPTFSSEWHNWIVGYTFGVQRVGEQVSVGENPAHLVLEVKRMGETVNISSLIWNFQLSLQYIKNKIPETMEIFKGAI